MKDSHQHEPGQGAAHGRRYASTAERLRAPERVALMEVPRVVDHCLRGIRPSSALDVGTGTGVFAQAFLERGLSVTGIDPNADLLEAARRLVPAGSFQEAVAEKLPFGTGTFDLVMLSHVLHETDDPALALAEARRVARLRVAVLEWPYLEEERGPRFSHRLPGSRIEALAGSAGFTGVVRAELAHMQLYLLTP